MGRAGTFAAPQICYPVSKDERYGLVQNSGDIGLYNDGGLFMCLDVKIIIYLSEICLQNYVT